jgi:hypothetical protein
MPNGTYGGVRGEAGDDLTYSIGVVFLTLVYAVLIMS